MAKKILKLIDGATITGDETGAQAHYIGGLENIGAIIDASSVGGTSPTFDFVIQTAPDTDGPWAQEVAFTQITQDGSEKKALSSSPANYIRYTVTVTGTGPTGVFKLHVFGDAKARQPN